MAQDREPLFAPDWLVDGDYVEEVLGTLKSGKESDVRLIARYGATRSSLIAEKRFKSRERRSFRDDHLYWSGRVFGERREFRAMRAGTRKGRAFIEGGWVEHEWQTLRRLHDAGVTVPPPVDRVDGGYRMAFVGDDERAAPRLVQVRLDPHEARVAYARLLDEVAAMLAIDLVHGDLSEYNVLWWRGRAVLIDFSQSVDTVTHPSARELLRRDLANLGSFFSRQGVAADLEDAWRAVGAERATSGRAIAGS